ncbi:MAG: haloacid dehalogenase type II [Longimicrobiales bacterium]|nr:haloacid dehalogenase type II [Longimicrobiales bacterium]
MNELFDGARALTFDCYGTIVDWETGILEALHELLAEADGVPDDETLLAMYGRFESELQAGPFQPYRQVLEEVARRFVDAVGAEEGDAQPSRFADSVGRWPPFPDSVRALEKLQKRYRLVIVSNVDDDLFHATRERLGVDFDEVVTAEQVRSYKPRLAHFTEALRRLELPKSKVVHVAQSLYHDIAPAKSFGVGCCWVDRRRGRSGGGATPPAEARPDLTVPDLAALARMALP